MRGRFLRVAPGSPRGHRVKSTVVWVLARSGFCPFFLPLTRRASGPRKGSYLFLPGFSVVSCVCVAAGHG